MKESAVRERITRGSFTVEASLLMGVVLFVLMGTIYLFFHVHNRAWLTCASYESALTGSMAQALRSGEGVPAARIKGRLLGNTGFHGGENLKLDVTGGSGITVAYDMDTRSAFHGFLWHIRTSATAKVLDPVKWIRQVRAASGVILQAG